MIVNKHFIMNLESIIVKTDKGYRKIYYHLIECVEAQNKKVLFCLNDNI